MHRSLRTAAAVGVFIAVTAASFMFSQRLTRPPRVVIDPETADFGNVVHEQQLDTEFSVHNNDSEKLVLDRFVTSCGCMTLAQMVEGREIPVGDRVVIEPGGRAVFATGMAAGTMKGPHSGTVIFETSSADLPQGVFEMRANLFGRMHAVPAALSAGRVLPGEQKQLRFVLTDGGRQEPFVLSRIDCSDSDTSVDVSQISEQSAAEVGGSPLYEVCVTFSRTHPGPVREHIRIYSADEEHGTPELEIPLTGEVVSPWSASPPAVVFPQRGKTDPYSAEVHVHNHLGQNVASKLSGDSTPDWLEVTFSNETPTPSVLLTVRPEARDVDRNDQLRIRVQSPGEHAGEFILQLPVFVTAQTTEQAQVNFNLNDSDPPAGSI